MRIRLACVLLSLIGLAGCISESRMSVADAGAMTCAQRKQGCYQAGYAGLTPLQREGRDTWYTWTGGDTNAQGEVVGDQALWRFLAVRTHGTVDLLQAVDSRYRGERFKRFGVINDPDCTQTAAPDQYGLWLDVCTRNDLTGDSAGESAGIVGLRRFKNPNFDPHTWDPLKYQADPAKVEPPYLIGVACGFCHVGFHPLHPPADPEHPAWQNLHAGIGNQYFREQIFNTAKYPETRGLKPDDFRWQAANAEPPGTSDTSQVATDHISNAGTINNIAFLNFRPMHTEVTADGVSRQVFHVLKDGADSVGSACLDDPTEKPGVNDTACAALRGYVNIGLCAGVWTTLQDPVYGLARKQAVFDIKRARQINRPCDQSWKATVNRLEGLEAFLRTMTPLHLADAEGARTLPRNDASIARGKIVFAENCASCHSSKRPPADFRGVQVQWFREAVMREDFLEDNFLSDDERHPISEIGTNAERALASNALPGHIWEQFSSDTYKNLQPVQVDGLVNPLLPLLRQPPVQATGGRGYYRTPTLANVWATAPFLHNNSVGQYNADPSVAGRLAAYESAMEMLLWPERRLGLKSIRRTTQKSQFTFEQGGHVCVARNTPVDLLENIHTSPGKFLTQRNPLDPVLCAITASGAANPLFLFLDNAPDFVQDRGHTFGATLSGPDKRALIEYVKTF